MPVLAMIGSGPLDTQCKAKAEKLGIAKNVKFFGFRDGVEKYKIIKSARVVVYPAVFEVGGMASAEALCCGLPGVVSICHRCAATIRAGGSRRRREI